MDEGGRVNPHPASAPIDPLLGPLADKGGPTLTHALLPGSPAIDAGNNAYATDWDQRGPSYPRITDNDPVVDIGAFEVQDPAASQPTGQPLPDPLPVSVLRPPAPKALEPELSTSGGFSFSPVCRPEATNCLPATETPLGARTASVTPWFPRNPGQIATRGNDWEPADDDCFSC